MPRTKPVYLTDIVVRKDKNTRFLVHILSAKTSNESLCGKSLQESTVEPGSYQLCNGCRRLYDVGMLGRI